MMTSAAPKTLASHDLLLEYLPLIRSIAVKAVRGLRLQDREEAVQEIIARTTVGWVGLAAQGRAHFWLIKPLATYAVRQWSAGRRVGTPVNRRDLLSPASRRDIRFWSLGSLEEDRSDGWRDVVADSRTTNPAEAACFRIDFEAWLRDLPERQKKVVMALTAGDTPTVIARRLNVGRTRVSQIRAELRASWEGFQSERALLS